MEKLVGIGLWAAIAEPGAIADIVATLYLAITVVHWPAELLLLPPATAGTVALLALCVTAALTAPLSLALLMTVSLALALALGAILLVGVARALPLALRAILLALAATAATRATPPVATAALALALALCLFLPLLPFAVLSFAAVVA